MKTITFEYEGKQYRLGFTRESVKNLEQAGFRINDIDEMPATMIPLFFYGAFAVYHSGVKRKLVDEIWENIPNKIEMLEALAELYADTMNPLLKGEVDEAKKIKWEVSQ